MDRVDQFIRDLKSDDVEARRAATSRLCIRDPRVLQPLIEALRDEDIRVRGKAAKGLEILADPRAVFPEDQPEAK